MRTPVRLQLSLADCGAACLAMVLSAHGRRTTIEECAAVVGGGRDGCSARSILEGAREMGMTASGHRIDDTDDIAELALPAIAFYMVFELIAASRAAAGEWYELPFAGPMAMRAVRRPVGTPAA